MTKNVFAGMWEIAAENGMNKSIARFPDVCLSPPSPPAGPVPIPYPDTSFSSNLKSGSSTVKIGGKGVALAQKSYYKEPVLGDEAATRTFGAAIITHQITGRTYFKSWCIDVKFENKNVCRHLDITTSNHASDPPSTPPAPASETQSFAQSKDLWNQNICPCCHEPLHEWQKDDTGKKFALIKESEFWSNKAQSVPAGEYRDKFTKIMNDMLTAKAEVRASAAASKSSCINVHAKEDAPCAIYFDVPSEAKSSYTSRHTGLRVEKQAKSARNWFDDNGLKDIALAKWKEYNPTGDFSGNTKLHHKTPAMAGGCANANNLTPDIYLQKSDKKCKEIESWQKKLEQKSTNTWK